MILLENSTTTIVETLDKKVVLDDKYESCNVSGCDFDGSTYLIKSDGKDKDALLVSIKVAGTEVYAKYGMDKILSSVYQDLVVPAEKDYTATLKINLKGMTAEKKAFILKEVPLIKRYVMASPFIYAFDKMLKNEKFETIRIPYRDEENIYIICYEGKSCVVLYSVKFKDSDDIVLAKTFLQEFKDARRDRTMGNAPSVNFSQGQKPLELKGIQSGEPDDPESLKAYGFISMGLFNRHMEDKFRNGTIDRLLAFRSYLHYHLKCSKAYMHFRMRDRYVLLLQNLEAAKDKTGKKKEMKTISGKRFERKV